MLCSPSLLSFPYPPRIYPSLPLTPVLPFPSLRTPCLEAGPLKSSQGSGRAGRLKMQDLYNAGPGKCLGSKMPDFVFKNQQTFVVELYNYLEQVTYLLLLIVK